MQRYEGDTFLLLILIEKVPQMYIMLATQCAVTHLMQNQDYILTLQARLVI